MNWGRVQFPSISVPLFSDIPEKSDAAQGTSNSTFQPVQSDPELSLPSGEKNGSIADVEETESDLLERDIVINNKSMAPTKKMTISGTSAKRRIPGAVKSAYQRKMLNPL